jgi:hypothetical protein
MGYHENTSGLTKEEAPLYSIEQLSPEERVAAGEKLRAQLKLFYTKLESKVMEDPYPEDYAAHFDEYYYHQKKTK